MWIWSRSATERTRSCGYRVDWRFISLIVTAYGQSLWDRPEGSEIWAGLSTPDHAAEVLTAAGVRS